MKSISYLKYKTAKERQRMVLTGEDGFILQPERVYNPLSVLAAADVPVKSNKF